MSLRIVMLGAPGSGKGTQAALLGASEGVPPVSTGDILRAAVREGTPIGRTVRDIMDRGELVDDALVLRLVEARIARPDCAGGFVLDGFPRSRRQAEDLESALEGLGARVDRAIHLEVPDEIVVRRLTGRLVCPACQALYREDEVEPGSRCTRCGTALGRRSDDREDVVRERIGLFRREVDGLLAFYGERGTLRAVDGTGPVPQVHDRVRAVLESESARTPAGGAAGR